MEETEDKGKREDVGEEGTFVVCYHARASNKEMEAMWTRCLDKRSWPGGPRPKPGRPRRTDPVVWPWREQPNKGKLIRSRPGCWLWSKTSFLPTWTRCSLFPTTAKLHLTLVGACPLAAVAPSDDADDDERQGQDVSNGQPIDWA